MKVAWLVVGLCVAFASAGVLNIKSERKVADATFLKRQKQILDLFVGVGHDEHFENKFASFDVFNGALYTDPSYAANLHDMYTRGMLPRDAVYSTHARSVRMQTAAVFDVFYFAKDFDTFYSVASWAKAHLNPIMFVYPFTLALIHRQDCKGMSFPPSYEVFPTYFVPADTMHSFYDMRMMDMKEGRIEFNSTGYEFNYNTNVFGGPLAYDVQHPHTEYKISYFREDVGLNNFYAKAYSVLSWMNPEKYTSIHQFKVGEKFFYLHQQLFARYTLERVANGLPWVEPFEYNKPIKVGYNPRITHFNGEAFIARPDGFNFEHSFYQDLVKEAEIFEDRLVDSIDFGAFWNMSTNSMYDIITEDGIDMVSHLMVGSAMEHKLNRYYYRSYYYTLLKALAYAANTKDSVDYNGGTTTMRLTSLRDPAYFQVLARVMSIYQKIKYRLPYYTKKDLKFDGVSVSSFEVDKFVTYFENYDFEVTNGVAVKNPEEYKEIKYRASQWRLNHKPYHYNITVNSDAAHDGMVRVFIGPKANSEEHILTLDQKRMAMVEIDRFPVKLAAGVNVFERNSKESPIFTSDADGFRTMYKKLNHALETNEPYYIKNEFTCGIPDRLQLPRGWTNGMPYTIAVVVSPMMPGSPEGAVCGSHSLYDNRAFGFPFDRPIRDYEFNVPNVFFKNELVYHKDKITA